MDVGYIKLHSGFWDMPLGRCSAWLSKQLTWFNFLSVGQHLKCQFSSLILRMLGFLPTHMWFVIQLEIWAILRQDIIKMRHSSKAIPLSQVLTSTQNLPALGSTSVSLVFFPLNL